ncbi:MAG: HEAT repeat domain-containing protein [Planctomycetota bacterium]
MRFAATLLLVLGAATATASAQDEDALRLLTSATAEERERGRELLRGDDSGSLLRSALMSGEPLAQEAAAAIIVKWEGEVPLVVRSPLRALLRNEKAAEVARRAAARALGALKDTASRVDLQRAAEAIPEDALLALAEIAEPAALPLVQRLRETMGEKFPVEGAYALAILGDAGGEDLLLDHLAGSTPGVAQLAHHLLRRLTGRDIGPSVARWREAIRMRQLARALGDRDWDASEAALTAALEDSVRAQGDLLHVLQHEPYGSDARAKAALGLGLLGSAAAGPALLEAATPGRDPFVRVYALEALGRVAWSPAAPRLARWLVFDEDTEVAKSFFDSTVPFHTVQPAACGALLAMGAEGAFGAVVDRLSTGGLGILPTPLVSFFKVRVHHEDLALFRRYGGPGAADGFGFLPDGSDEDRHAAGQRAVAWWLSHPKNLNVETRANWSDPAFVAAVEQEIVTLGEYKFLEMDRSRRALILLGSPVVPHLVNTLARDPESDPTGQSRAGIAGVLASIGARDAIPAVRDAMKRAKLAPVKAKLLTSLADLHPDGGVPEAMEFLRSSDPSLKGAAAEALGTAPTADAAPVLRKVLAAGGKDRLLRIRCAGALLAIRDTTGISVLLDALDHDDSIVRRQSWKKLDAHVEGLGPYEPRSGKGGAVRARWEAMSEAPRFRNTGSGR